MSFMTPGEKQKKIRFISKSAKCQHSGFAMLHCIPFNYNTHILCLILAYIFLLSGTNSLALLSRALVESKIKQ